MQAFLLGCTSANIQQASNCHDNTRKVTKIYEPTPRNFSVTLYVMFEFDKNLLHSG